MKTADLPLSDNVEDRRGEGVNLKPRLTLNEMLAQPPQPLAPEPQSVLAKQAGVDDIADQTPAGQK
jgi:hypothetical protein